MPEIKVVKKVTIPTHFTLGPRFYRAAAEKVYKDQHDAVARQQIDAAGRALKRNTKPTRDKKTERGQPQLSLVDGWRGSGNKAKAPKGDRKTLNELRAVLGVKGHVTNDHHFIGRNAFKVKATKTQATVELHPEAKRIAKYLEDGRYGEGGGGYKAWFAIREPTRKRVMDDAVRELRLLWQGDIKKRGK